eukprot:g8210.t1
MGNASSHSYAGAAPPPAADARVILQHDLPKVIYVKRLANGKFIKSYQCRVDGVMVVVKAYIKMDPLENLAPVEACLSKMAKALDTRSCPNVLPYQRWLQSNVRASPHKNAGTPAYLLRQHLLGTLSDRLSTRPFLTDTEKRWLVYLLLRAAAQCHGKGVCHGDIKSENVLVTSGNWLLLTDFAPFKPTLLPDDHPADANYYFSSGEQGRCYLAPERFYSAPQAPDGASATGGGGGAGASATGAPRAARGAGAGLAGARGAGLDGLEASVIQPGGSDEDNSNPPGREDAAGAGVNRKTGDSSESLQQQPQQHQHQQQQHKQQQQQQQQQRSKQGGASGRGEGSAGAGGGGWRQGGGPGEGLLESMDVFSLGCVIAEIFLGGDPLLDLPGLLRYRISGDMEERLKKLEAAGGPVVLRLVEHMVQRDAGKRKTVKEYIRRMEKPGTLFPRSFGSFLFPLLATMHAGEGAGETPTPPADTTTTTTATTTADIKNKQPTIGAAAAAAVDGGGGRAVRSPDERLALVARSYGRAMCELAGTPDPEGHALLLAALADAGSGKERGREASGGRDQGGPAGRRERQGVGDGAGGGSVEGGGGDGGGGDGGGGGGDLNELMERTRSLIARVEALGVGTPHPSNETAAAASASTSSSAAAAAATSARRQPPAIPDEPATAACSPQGQGAVVATGGGGGGGGGEGGSGSGGGGGGDSGSLIILVQVVCSCLRHLRYPRSRLLALNLLVAFGRCCDDEARLQRLVPYTMTMLEDSVPVVRATAVRSLRALLGMVTSFPPSDSNIFLLYIFPALQRLPSDSSDLVRIAFAESLASLAETSRRFLETAYAMRRAAAASTAAAAASAAASAAAAAEESSSRPTSTTGGRQEPPGTTSGDERNKNDDANNRGDDQNIPQQEASPSNGTAGEESCTRESGRKDTGGSAGADGAREGHAGEGTTMASYEQEKEGVVGVAAEDEAETEAEVEAEAEAGPSAGGSGGGSSAAAAGAALLDGSYDKELSSIRGQISRWFVVLASSGGAGSLPGDWSGVGMGGDGGGAGVAAVMVKRALLADITRLCVFFGFENTLDSILPQLITFLNDRDWSLRAAFCEHIPAVCAMAGEVATARFILPCIENTLVDAREAVVASGLKCLAALAALGLLPRHALPAQAAPAAPLLQHPGLGVRAGAVELIVRVAEALGPLDTQVFLYPVLRPHLRYALAGALIEARRRAGGGGGGASAEDGGQRQQLQQQSAPRDNAAPRNGYRRQASDNSSSSGSSGSGSGGGGGGGGGAEETEALVLLRGCIDTAAQHAANKGRGISGGSSAGGGGGGGDGGGISSSISSSSGGGSGSNLTRGRSSPVYLPETQSQAIYVPTQKITTLHPGVGAAAVAVATALASTAADGAADGGGWGVDGDEEAGAGEDGVDVRLCSPALSASPGLLQSVTGMHTNAVDARRAMALVEQPDVADGGDGGGGSYASPRAGAAGRQGRGGDGSPALAWEASKGAGVAGIGGGRSDDAAALVRRAKALGVPPLPPDLGAVRAPNGAKYSHYLLDSRSGVGGGGVGGTSSASGGGGGGGGGGGAGTNSRPSYPATVAAAAAAAQQEHYPSPYDHGHGGRRPDWRPRQGVLVASLNEHAGAVNRLALSQDQAFFVSASSDSTCKVWELRGMDHTVSPQSRATYSRQGGRLLDLCMVDNSHSVASASSDGTVHVWRVELAASASGTPYGSFTVNPNAASGAAYSSGAGLSSNKAAAALREQPGGPGFQTPHGGGGGGNDGGSGSGVSARARRYSGAGAGGNVDPTVTVAPSSSGAGGGGVARAGRGGGGLRVCGSSMVRCVSPQEGAVVSVHHFNTELGSPLVYGTRKGGVRSWDLRAREEPWALRAHPELGFLTVIALGTEKTWLVVGTSRGFVMLWDLRFQILARLWRHSSGGAIHKLATCSRLPPPDAAQGPHVIVAAGRNEAAIWDLSKGGPCKQCFRVVPPSEGPPQAQPSSRGGKGQDPVAVPGAELPVLEEVSLPSHPNAPALSLGAQLSAVRDFSAGAPQAGGDPAIRALVGRISRSERDSYLITGGTDRCIRYWDFQAASRCYMVSGREPYPGRPAPRALHMPGVAPGQRSTVVMYYDEDAPSGTPSLTSKSGALPMVQEKGLVAPRTSHDDAVLDVKVTELPTKMLLSGSRDGAVKIWK